MERILYEGDSGADVSLLQLGLERYGTDPGTVDGIFGARTRKALLRFQTQVGIPADGIAGMQTWDRLTPWLLGFVRYTVRPGDTLYRLAMKNRTSIAAITAANPGIDPERLAIGTEIVIPLGFPVVSEKIPYTSRAVGYAAEGLCVRYPFLTQTVAGKSVLGQPLRLLTVGEGSHHLFINASHHANEWITTPVVLSWLERYCMAYVENGVLSGVSARALFGSTRVSVMPLVNPDGVDLVTGVLTDTAALENVRSIAARYPSIPFPDGWKANIEGTDLNLQYPAGWKRAQALKFAQGYTSPAPRDYVGTGPLTAPESLAVYDATLQNGYDLSLSYHTQGEVLYWQYQGSAPEGAQALGERLSAVSGYALESTPAGSDNAGYKDWFILRYDRPGYTVEAGSGENPLPLTQLPTLLQANIPLMTEALRYLSEQAV